MLDEQTFNELNKVVDEYNATKTLGVIVYSIKQNSFEFISFYNEVQFQNEFVLGTVIKKKYNKNHQIGEVEFRQLEDIVILLNKGWTMSDIQTNFFMQMTYGRPLFA